MALVFGFQSCSDQFEDRSRLVAALFRRGTVRGCSVRNLRRLLRHHCDFALALKTFPLFIRTGFCYGVPVGIALAGGNRTLASLLLIIVVATGAPVLCVSTAHVGIEFSEALCCGIGDAERCQVSPAASGLSAGCGCGACVDIALTALTESHLAVSRASRAAAAFPDQTLLRPARTSAVPSSSPSGPVQLALPFSTEIPLSLRC